MDSQSSAGGQQDRAEDEHRLRARTAAAAAPTTCEAMPITKATGRNAKPVFSGAVLEHALDEEGDEVEHAEHARHR